MLRVVALLSIGLAAHAQAADRDGGTMVTVTQLRTGKVVGELGVPLGTLAKIEAIVVSGDELKTKAASGKTFLRVTKVDARMLDAPVVIAVEAGDAKLPKPGAGIHAIAYESGSFSGAPDGLFNHVEPFATEGFGFRNVIVVVKVDR